MAIKGGLSCSTTKSTMVVAIALILITLVGQSYGELKVGFYIGKCRNSNVEQVIFDVVNAAFQKDRTIVAALLRMQFHDCFVNGCDASLLLDGSNTEKTAGPNLSVRGYELIDACKISLEQKCPGIVSCADIIAIATRVAVNLAGGRWYSVETGRRDGIISRASDANNLPGPSTPVSTAVQLFRNIGLSPDDLVLLLGGGHTVGKIQCSFIMDRLYNYQGTGTSDPTMNPSALSSMRQTCPATGSSNSVFVDQTPGSEFTVDKGFYTATRAGAGVLEIDQRIAQDPITRDSVRRLAITGDFAFQFGGAMVRLGRAGVLTGTQGQIRRSCKRVNNL